MFKPRALTWKIAPLAAFVALCISSNSFAVILYRSATRNTSAPTGTLLNTGWQFEGKWGSFTGTLIGPDTATSTPFFITAAHVGGAGSFEFNGTQYFLDTSFGGSGPGFTTEPGTDLRIFKLQTSISTFAHLYDGTAGSEIGKLMTVFGRGTQRGAAVYGRYTSPPRDGDGDASTTHELKGWADGPSDAVPSWGTNYVSSIVNGGPSYHNLLTFNFDRLSDLPDESTLSNGDSGGGVFIQSGGEWKLAGINLAVDGAFKLGPDFPAFNGAIFDKGGLYEQVSDTDYAFDTDSSGDLPSAAYSTEIASNVAWIHSVIDGYFARDIPEPSSALLIGWAASAALLRRRHSSSASRLRAAASFGSN